MSNYKYAIIVPNYNSDHGDYNGKTFLRNCIESILNQTYKDFTLIFVDDMSTDTSVKTVKEYMKKDKRIKLIQNIRKRYNGGSRNVGIEYAMTKLDFDYFCFLDSDDWWKYDTVLETIDSKLNDHEMLILGCEMLNRSGKVIHRRNQIARDYEDLWSCTNKIWCTAWSRVIRKDKIKYFCESTLMEDRLWCYKVADDIDFDKVTYSGLILYVWNQLNTTSVSKSKTPMWNYSAFIHIGQCKQFMAEIKHKEMLPILEERINKCFLDLKNGVYYQG